MIGQLKKHIFNIRGKKTTKKLLVFESDDWGSIRIPDEETRNLLLKKGYINEKDPFSRFDTLETKFDLENLCNVLIQFKDSNTNSPVITTNTIVANPDFDKIKASGFNDYFFEPFTKTYTRFSGSENAFEVFKKGIDSGLLYPQFHGREHLNVPMWMKLLQQNNKTFIEAFDVNCFSIDYNDASNKRGNVMASYDYNSEEEFSFIQDSINEGLALFENLFGFSSKTFIAPCYVWNEDIEKVFNDKEIKGIQGSRFQQMPIKNQLKFKKKFHYTGEVNHFGQMYFQRNGLFEPSLNRNIDWVDKCMESIEIAFMWNKAAIIGSHRINFVGGLDRFNSDHNLMLLKELFRRIIKKWPDIEFVTTVDLLNEL